MGLRKHEKGAAEQKDTSTFFAAAESKAEDQKPKAAHTKPTAQVRQTPASTFFSNRHTDPLRELSTHRALNGNVISADERVACKEAQEQRARRGLTWLMTMLTRDSAASR